jgi:hypothetical protein
VSEVIFHVSGQGRDFCVIHEIEILDAGEIDDVLLDLLQTLNALIAQVYELCVWLVLVQIVQDLLKALQLNLGFFDIVFTLVLCEILLLVHKGNLF